jgi:hypothetical protein
MIGSQAGNESGTFHAIARSVRAIVEKPKTKIIHITKNMPSIPVSIETFRECPYHGFVRSLSISLYASFVSVSVFMERYYYKVLKNTNYEKNFKVLLHLLEPALIDTHIHHLE